MPLIDRVAGVFHRVFACDAGRILRKPPRTTSPTGTPSGT